MKLSRHHHPHPLRSHGPASARLGWEPYLMSVSIEVTQGDGGSYFATSPEFTEILLTSDSVAELMEQVPHALRLIARLRYGETPTVLPVRRPGPLQAVTREWGLLFTKGNPGP